MPFKLNHNRRHRIPRQEHKVANSAAYDAVLRQRGSARAWFTNEAIAGWRAAQWTILGGQPMNKAQQMRWIRASVQPFLDMRTAVLNDTLEDAFRRRHPSFRPANDDHKLTAVAA